MAREETIRRGVLPKGDEANAMFLYFAKYSPCKFARQMALEPHAHRWESITIAEILPDLGDFISATLDAMLKRGVQVAQIIFPKINTTPRVVDLILALASTPRWKCKAYKCPEGTPPDKSLFVGLQWWHQDEIHYSWVLGLTDINSMPVTRRMHVPFTTLVLRLGGPGTNAAVYWNDPDEPQKRDKKGSGKIYVHLADVPSPFPDSMIPMEWDRTSRFKNALLRDDLMKGASHPLVTFSLPNSFHQRLEGVISPETSWGILFPLRQRNQESDAQA